MFGNLFHVNFAVFQVYFRCFKVLWRKPCQQLKKFINMLLLVDGAPRRLKRIYGNLSRKSNGKGWMQSLNSSNVTHAIFNYLQNPIEFLAQIAAIS